MGKYFGTDGFRGEANVDLTAYHAYKVGRFLGNYYSSMAKKAKIVIGKDTRRSSYMLEYSLVSGIVSSGADAYLLHVTTTPSVAYVVKSDDFDCGIMISASHNPYYDNGIKILDSNGYKISPEIESMIEAYIDNEKDDLPLAKKDKIGITVDYAIGRNRYIGYLMSLVTRSFKNIKVGLDCSNGASYMVAKGLFDALGAKTYILASDPDGTNINDNCGSTHIEKLVEFVKENKLDIGFAYDGDADRCLCVSENGDIIDGDAILYLCGTYLKRKNKLTKNTVVTTVMSNIGLIKALENEGIKCEITDVGDKYVNECMVQNSYSLGGEQSGHIIFRKYATTGDGILTSIKIMEVMLEEKSSLSDLLRNYKIYPQKLVNVKVKDKNEVIEDKDLINLMNKMNDEFEGNGRVLVRRSGTEPLIRLMCEASSDEICINKIDELYKLIEEKGYLK